MILNLNKADLLTGLLEKIGYLPGNARQYFKEMAADDFVFHDQLIIADSIHFHIKVADVNELPHTFFLRHGAQPQNAKEGYIKYAFADGINFIFSSIPVSQEEKSGIASYNFPYLDHIGIDIRQESDVAYHTYKQIPLVAAAQGWAFKKQGGEGKKVYCCHVQVNEKYWVYPTEGVYWEFAFGQLVVSDTVFGCDLRPANPALGLPEQDTTGCCGITDEHDDAQAKPQGNSYYQPEDLKKFGNIGEFQKEYADKFFSYYGEVFKDNALTAREKSLIALAVAHAVQCPYCIDAYSADTMTKGYTKEQMMEAVHVAAAIKGGATLVHGVQMMNKVNSLTKDNVPVT